MQLLAACLWGKLPTEFAALLTLHPIPMAQLQLDIVMMSETERIRDGSVPLVIWLQAILSFYGAVDSNDIKTIQSYLSLIAQRSSGAPDVAPATREEVQEAVVHQDDMVPLSFLRSGLAAASSIAKLMVPRFEAGVMKTSNSEPVIFLGTGWLIAPRVLITNHHVFNARMKGEAAAPKADFDAQAINTTAIFDYDDREVSGTTATIKELVAADLELDYAIARITIDGRTPLPITKELPTPRGGHSAAAVNIIQHPDGRPKQVAIRNNLIAGTTERDLRYFTDTLGGSSGSPVMDDEWRVVALHRGHTFVTGIQFQGKTVAYLNVGTRLSAILAHVQANFSGKLAELGV